jgi:glycosyltransferase involved in cell wall biosynthesis
VKITAIPGGFARIGGIETSVVDLLSSMAARGIDSEIYCWDGASPHRNPMLDSLAACGVRVHRSPWRWGCRWAWPDRLLLASAGAAMLDTDIVLFCNPFRESVHRRLLALRGARRSPRFILATSYRPAEMWGAAPPDPAFLNSFDLFCVQAESFRADLRLLGCVRPVQVLPYIPPACNPVAPLPNSLRIGFLGRFVPDKNLPFLLTAFREVLRRQSATLHLFGDGPLRAPLSDLARALDIESAVFFHGSVPPAGVPAAIDSCSLFAFTSKTEGQCMAALEILSRGRMLAATPVGAFPEIIRDPRLGGIAPADDAASFASALLAAAAQPRDPLEVQSVYERQFNRRHTIDEYVELFTTLCPCRAGAQAGTC